MPKTLAASLSQNFLGNTPNWYKLAILCFLVINPIVFAVEPFAAGWLLIVEFIFTLAMALKCYPLQPGGLLAIEAVIIGMTSPESVMHEVSNNLPVLLLLMFMVAGIHFMKDLLLYIFTKLLVNLRSKIALSLSFCFATAFLSAFLDALTVIAVVIAVATGFYSIYHKVASGKEFGHTHDHTDDEQVNTDRRSELEEFRGFLRNLLLHAGVGTALGGVMTQVGEPQNLIIAAVSDWHFVDFFLRMAPVTVPVFVCGLLTCIVVEKFHVFGYGYKLPDTVHTVLKDYASYQDEKRTKRDLLKLVCQGLIGVWLITALALHLAEVGLIGLSVIILATTFSGITEEAQVGKAFEEAMPFAALLTVFFTVVAVIIDQHLFAPVIHWVLSFDGHGQLWRVFAANGLLSMVSDNVFVGTVYITEMANALTQHSITRDQYDLLAVAVNTGTNLPSVATPNGQAAFLFLLTSALAPLLRLSYGRMVLMALPYTIVLTVVAIVCILFVLEPATQGMYGLDLLHHMSPSDVHITGH